MKKLTASILSAMLMLSMVFSSSVFAANDATQASAWDSFVGLFTKATTTADTVGVQYKAHIQNKGTMTDYVTGPTEMGTRGEGLRMEGFWIKLTNAPADLKIKYDVQIENEGWLKNPDDVSTWFTDDQFAGSQDKSQRIETIKLVLVDSTGAVSKDYSVQYKGHVQNIGNVPENDTKYTGTTGWYADGEQLGTVGSSLRLEALQVKIVQKVANLDAYNTAIAAVKQADYTAASWTTYQAVVTANPAATTDLQSKVDAATAAITAAQANLVKVLKVESVSAINSTQLKVTFSAAANKISAETLANYKLQGTALTGSDKIVLATDGLSAIITLNTTSVLTNNNAYSVEVKNVKAAIDNSVAPTALFSFIAKDTEAPTITSAVATAGTAGTKKVTVNFSEPIGTSGTYKIDGKSVAVSALAATTAKQDNTKVTLTTTDTLVAGTTYSLVAASVADYVGNVNITQTVNFTVVSDTTQGALVSATPFTEVKAKLTYDKEINTNTISNSNLLVQKLGGNFGTCTVVIDPDDAKSVLVTIGTPGYSSVVKTIDPIISLTGLKDIYGNAIADVKEQKVTLTKDETKPVGVSATLSSDNKSVVLELSEAVTAGSVSAFSGTSLTAVVDGVATAHGLNAATIVKADGTAATTSSKYVKLYKTGGTALAKGEYAFTLAAGAFTDTSMAANTSELYKFNISVSDATNTTPITVGTPSATTVNADGTETFTLGFGTMLNETARQLGNYSIDGYSLPTDTSIVFTTTAKDTVSITLPAGSITADKASNLGVANVQNSAGTVQTAAVVKTLNVKDNKAPQAVSAELNAAGALVVTFDEVVTATGTAPTGLTLVNKADGTVAVTSSAASALGKQVTFTIAASNVDLTKVTASIVAGAVKDTSVTQNANTVITGLAVTDNFVSIPTPVLSQVTANANSGDITVTLSNWAALSAQGVDSFDVYLYDVSGAVTSTTVGSFTKSVNVLPSEVNASTGAFVLPASITNDAKTGTAINFTNALYVTVVAKQGSNAAYSSEATITLDLTAPTLSSVVLADGSGGAGLAVSDTVAITFNSTMAKATNTTFTLANGVITLTDGTTFTFATPGVNAGSGTIAWTTSDTVATLTFTTVTTATSVPSGVVTPSNGPIKDLAGNKLATGTVTASGAF